MWLVWLVSTILDILDKDDFFHCREFYWTMLLNPKSSEIVLTIFCLMWIELIEGDAFGVKV